MNSSLSKNTLRAYASAWRAFRAWCGEAARTPLPAEPDTVQDFIVWSITEGYRIESCYSRMSAIAHYHRAASLPSPLNPSIWQLMQNAKRHLKERPAGMTALTPELLKRILEKFSDKYPVDVRNKALLLVTFAAGWRRSEPCQLDRTDVEFTGAGMTLFQPSSKTDQEAHGRFVFIARGRNKETCPVSALQRWLELRGDWHGPLFTRCSSNGTPGTRRLYARGDVLYRLMKDCLAKIGVDPTHYGAHSTRSGMMTASAENGADVLAIMQRTGHRSIASVIRYIRPVKAFQRDPLAGVL